MQNEIIQKYITSFNLLEQNLNGEKDGRLHQVRKDALKSFVELGFPGRKNELWKYTDVSSFSKNKLEAYVKARDPKSIDAASVNLYSQIKANRLVFLNGHFQDSLSEVIEKGDGHIIGSLKQHMDGHSDLILPYLGKQVDVDRENFGALNTAFMRDGAFIHLDKNVALEYPVIIIFLTDGDEQIISNPRNLIIANENSQLQIIEDSQSLNAGVACHTNLLTEVFLEQSANVHHTIIQDQHDAYHQIGTYKISQKRGSFYKSATISFGGKLIRNNLEVTFNEDHTETDLQGVYISGNKDMIDNHLLVNHLQPHCLSNQLYKGILDDEGKAVFNGKVLVAKDAQKTNAYQSNKNILLSRKCTINTKPELEIFADDVKCSHGATSGQLDEDAVFYLKARGIPESKAKSLLTYAFAYEILEGIKNETLRSHIDTRLRNKLKLDQI